MLRLLCTSNGRSMLWNDPDICIDWPTSADPILSYKDTAAPLLSDLESPFVFGENSEILVTGGAGFIGSAVAG